MTLGRIVIVLCFVVLLGLPIVVRPERAAVPDGASSLVIISPHNEQIRAEFGRAFEAHQLAVGGEPVQVIWLTPGGTGEIRKMLQSQYRAALRDGVEPGGAVDLFFGGGSYEFSQLAKPITVEVDGEPRSISVLAPVDFSDAWLRSMYGDPPVIGGTALYDVDEKKWFGAAVSGFGIVYNHDVLERLGLDPPRTWADLAHPRYRGWIASANPAQSGSVTTAMQAILEYVGWREGWRILRRIGANSRYFSASSQKPPNDVGRGDAAAGLCIDFYGRFQAQSILDATGDDRLGYIDPPGVTVIDPDPIAMLRGARRPDLAKTFIEFVLSDEGQALWQFRVDDPHDDGLGPDEFELRRLPIRREFYGEHLPRFVDQVNPYAFAKPPPYANRDFRSFIPVVFNAMIIENHDALREAWTRIVTHPAFPADDPLVEASAIEDPELRAMIAAFDAMPTAPGANGASLSLADPTNVSAIKAGWSNDSMWRPESSPRDQARLAYAAFFAGEYERILDGVSRSRSREDS